MPESKPAGHSQAVPVPVPDYDLADEVLLSSDPIKHKAIANPLRHDILDLVLDRAASIGELAGALGKPRSTVAYHTDILLDAGLLKVVRTRKVRAIEERFYGRTGRTIVWDAPSPSMSQIRSPGFLQTAVSELRDVGEGEYISSTLRHARIPASRARDFFAAVDRLAVEYTNLDRGGETVYGFVAAIYPTDRPHLPDAQL